MLTGTERQWHGMNEIHPVITLRDPATNAIARWDVREIPLLLPSGKDTGFKLLEAYDHAGEAVFPVGQPFGDSYRVFGNEAFLSLVEALCGALDKAGVKWKIKSTGSVRARNLVFLSIEIEEASKYVVDGREFQNFLSILNSFDKSTRVTIKDSSICIVCSNTFHAALADDAGAMAVSVVHKKNMIAALGDVPKMVEAAITGRKAMLARLNSWAAFPVKLSEAENIFAAFIGNGDAKKELSVRSANIIEKLTSLFSKGKGNKGQTALDLFQAATEYYTHFNAGESENRFKQLESSEFGAGADRKLEFFDTLCRLTEAGDKWGGFARIGETILVNYRKGKGAGK